VSRESEQEKQGFNSDSPETRPHRLRGKASHPSSDEVDERVVEVEV
jgi:hypothetical protein